MSDPRVRSVVENRLAASPGSGITIIEAPASDQPIDAAADPIAAFIGRCLAGPLNTPVAITSFAQFERLFGGRWTGSSLGDQLALFFQHGGRKALVVRVANHATGARLALPTADGALTLVAVNPGSGERVRASVDYDGIDDDLRFNLTLQRLDYQARQITDQEIHPGLSVAEGDDHYLARLADSELARPLNTQPVAARPMLTRSERVGGGVEYVSLQALGGDGEPLSDYDLIGSDRARTGLFALDDAEHFDFLYACGGRGLASTGAAYWFAAERYCATRNAMLIVDPPATCDSADALLDWRRHAALDSASMLHYFPPLRLRHERDDRLISAAGALAGLLARQDDTAHVHAALADNLGQNSAALHRDWVAAWPVSTDDALKLLNAGTNPIIDGSQRRLLFPGLVTAANRRDRKSGSLTEQRLIKFILRKIESGTRWAMFAEPGPSLWARVEEQVGRFLEELAAFGALQSDDERPGWSVRCDQHSQQPGQRLRLLVAFLPHGRSRPLAFSISQNGDGTSACRMAFSYDEG